METQKKIDKKVDQILKKYTSPKKRYADTAMQDACREFDGWYTGTGCNGGASYIQAVQKIEAFF